MTLEEQLKSYGLTECDLSTLKERQECRVVYEQYKEAMKDAKGIKQMLEAAKIEYNTIEGKNNWHESAIKDKFGIEVYPELQEFYALGLDTTEGILYNFDYVLRVNHEFRHDTGFSDLYMPFDHHFIIGQEDNGDFLMLAYRKNLELMTDIIHWNHESDERTIYCGEFGDFLARRSSFYSNEASWMLW